MADIRPSAQSSGLLDDSLEGRRIVVLGGSGFIGREVVELLVGHDADVTVFGRSTPIVAPEAVVSKIGSIEDPGSVRAAVENAEVVICLASSSLPGHTDYLAEIDNHLKPTVSAAQLAADAGATRFIFASSGGTVYGMDSAEPLVESCAGRPRNAYGVSKLAIEHYLRLIGRQSSMTTLSLRVANPFGRRQDAGRGQGFIAAVFAHLYRGDPLNIWGDGRAIRDFVDVADVAQAFLKACVYEGEATELNVGSGVGRSLNEVLAEVEAATGLRPEPGFEPGRLVDVACNVLDIERSSRELGWQPLVPFADSLQATAEWWEMVAGGRRASDRRIERRRS